MPDSERKERSAGLMVLFARVDRETRHIVGCSALDALKRARNGDLKTQSTKEAQILVLRILSFMAEIVIHDC